MFVRVPPLSKRDRAALLLASGLSAEEVAAELGVSAGTVRRWRRGVLRGDISRLRLRMLNQAADALVAGSRHWASRDRPTRPTRALRKDRP